MRCGPHDGSSISQCKQDVHLAEMTNCKEPVSQCREKMPEHCKEWTDWHWMVYNRMIASADRLDAEREANQQS